MACKTRSNLHLCKRPTLMPDSGNLRLKIESSPSLSFFQDYSLQYKATRLVSRPYIILLGVGLVRKITIVGIFMEMPSFTMTVPMAK